VVITKNEEKRIGDCLKRLNWCDEVVLVDSRSGDRTLDIARSMGARVFVKDWEGFGAQKNFGMDQASGDWILFVEADEWITDELRDEILSSIGSEAPDGFKIPRLNIFLGKPVWHSDMYPDYQLRLIRKGSGRYTEENPPHESIRISGKIGHLRRHMIHRSYEKLSDFAEKMDKYTDVSARDLVERGKHTGPVHMITRTAGRWIKVWLLKRGFLDGDEGCILAGLYAFYVFCKYAKVWELRQKGGAPSCEVDEEGVPSP